MIAGTQQRLRHRTNRRHAAGKADGCNAIFHPGDFVFERRDARITLARIAIAGLLALEHIGQQACVFVTEGHRGMDRT
ncbi:hypothetical protein SDC9_209476 [bioreactor metagenome]|uniref:Uncharacterized protein n=1 Tax=bioreactor metagenome TaxID=1076179 RepID=A0A645JN33_9ZZZZ